MVYPAILKVLLEHESHLTLETNELLDLGGLVDVLAIYQKATAALKCPQRNVQQQA